MRRWTPIVVLLAAGCHAQPSATPLPPDGQTDRPLDLSISGEGYFIVQTTAGGYLFTRRGAISVSSTGELINDAGYKLYPVITTSGEKVTVTRTGVVQEQTGEAPPVPAGQILLVRFPNAAALDRDGVYSMPTAASGDPITGKPGMKGLGTIVSGRITD